MQLDCFSYQEIILINCATEDLPKKSKISTEKCNGDKQSSNCDLMYQLLDTAGIFSLSVSILMYMCSLIYYHLVTTIKKLNLIVGKPFKIIVKLHVTFSL